MHHTSTFETAGTLTASHISSNSLDRDSIDDELTGGLLRRLGSMLRRLFTRRDPRLSNAELGSALAEGRRRAKEARKEARRQKREARAQLAREKRELRAARKQGLLLQEMDDDLHGKEDIGTADTGRMAQFDFPTLQDSICNDLLFRHFPVGNSRG